MSRDPELCTVSQHRPHYAPAGPSTRGDPPAPDASPPKATLFCPACGHRDHVSGDWEVREPGSGDRSETAFRSDRPPAPGGHLRCPECGTTITGGTPADAAPAPGLAQTRLAVRTGLALSPLLWTAGIRRWWSLTEPLVSGRRRSGAEDR